MRLSGYLVALATSLILAFPAHPAGATSLGLVGIEWDGVKLLREPKIVGGYAVRTLT